MKVKQYMAIVERRSYVPASLLPAFEEIARTSVKLIRTCEGVVHPLQSYLDERIVAGGVLRSRRSIILAIHDMAQDSEAPLPLQRKVLGQLMMLQMRPVPRLTLYRDIATAILRMEVVIRLSAAQGLRDEKSRFLNPAAVLSQWEDEARQWLLSSREAVSAAFAGVWAGLRGLHAPRLPALALSALRYAGLPALEQS